jgi:hypothetical protein
VPVTVTWNRAAIDNLLHGPTGPVAHDLERRGDRVEDDARRRAPQRTGALRASLRAQPMTVGRDRAVRVGSDKPYAMFVHQGRGEVTRAGGFLRWPATSSADRARARTGFVYARRARATSGTPYLRLALNAAR